MAEWLKTRSHYSQGQCFSDCSESKCHLRNGFNVETEKDTCSAQLLGSLAVVLEYRISFKPQIKYCLQFLVKKTQLLNKTFSAPQPPPFSLITLSKEQSRITDVLPQCFVETFYMNLWKIFDIINLEIHTH